MGGYARARYTYWPPTCGRRDAELGPDEPAEQGDPAADRPCEQDEQRRVEHARDVRGFAKMPDADDASGDDDDGIDGTQLAAEAGVSRRGHGAAVYSIAAAASDTRRPSWRRSRAVLARVPQWPPLDQRRW